MLKQKGLFFEANLSHTSKSCRKTQNQVMPAEVGNAPWRAGIHNLLKIDSRLRGSDLGNGLLDLPTVSEGKQQKMGQII